MTVAQSRFGKSFLVNPDAPAGHIEEKWRDPDLGSGILSDAGKYFRGEYMERERDRLWSRTWNLAGRVSDVANPGDYFRFDLGWESFIVTRDIAGVIRAFYNVCPHRGSRIIARERGNAANFTCRFHAWSWNLDGTLRAITDAETFDPSLIADRPGLAEVQASTWGGFVFINPDPAAPPLERYLDVLVAHLADYRFEDMMVISDVTVEWPVNWKIALDAFQEGYHIQSRHPEGLRYLDDYHCQRDLFPNGHGRLIFPMGLTSPRVRDPSSLTPELRDMLLDVGLDPAEFEGRAADVRGAMQARKRAWAADLGIDYAVFTDSQLTDDWNYSIFPNVTFNIHCENALMMRFRPHPSDPARCFYDVMVLAHRIPDPDYRLPSYMGMPPDLGLSQPLPRPPHVELTHGEASLGLVLDQDAEMLPSVQQGVRSRAFRGTRLSQQEIRMRHFYREYDRYLGRA